MDICPYINNGIVWNNAQIERKPCSCHRTKLSFYRFNLFFSASVMVWEKLMFSCCAISFNHSWRVMFVLIPFEWYFLLWISAYFQRGYFCFHRLFGPNRACLRIFRSNPSPKSLVCNRKIVVALITGLYIFLWLLFVSFLETHFFLAV